MQECICNLHSKTIVSSFRLQWERRGTQHFEQICECTTCSEQKKFDYTFARLLRRCTPSIGVRMWCECQTVATRDNTIRFSPLFSLSRFFPLARWISMDFVQFNFTWTSWNTHKFRRDLLYFCVDGLLYFFLFRSTPNRFGKTKHVQTITCTKKTICVFAFCARVCDGRWNTEHRV